MKIQLHMALCFFLLSVLSVCGRDVQTWQYDQLTEQADLVVIATPVSVKDTGIKTPIPYLSHTDDLVGMETTFDAISVLRGDKNVKRFVLFHLRHPTHPPGEFWTTNIGLMNFDPKEKGRFLLFLRKEKNGRYTPIAGQADVGDSVKPLGTYP